MSIFVLRGNSNHFLLPTPREFLKQPPFWMSTQLWRVIIPWLKIFPQHFSWILCWFRPLRLSRNAQSTSLSLLMLYLILTSSQLTGVWCQVSDLAPLTCVQIPVSYPWMLSLLTSFCDNEGIIRGSAGWRARRPQSISSVCIHRVGL